MFFETTLEKILKQIIKIIIFLILLLPLLVYEQSLFPFVFPRTLVFRVLVEIALASYLILVLFRRQYLVKSSALVWIVFGFLATIIFTSAFGVDPYHSFSSSIERSEGILTLLHLAALFVLSLATFRTKKEWLQLFNIALLAFWPQIVYSLGQIYDWSWVLASDRVSGTLGNPSFFASYLLILIFLAAYLFIQYRRRLAKAYYLIIMALGLTLLWLTQNRGALLGLTAGVVFFLIARMISPISKRAKIITMAALASIFILTAALAVNREANWISSSPTLRRLANISTKDITAQNRTIVWRAGWRAFQDRPFLGWGWENFNAAFNAHFDPAITRDIGSRPWYDRAHNTLVEVAVASGVFGLAFYLAIFAWLIKLLWPKEKDGKISTDKLILLGLLLAYFVQNLFVFDTLNTYLMFFLLLAFVQFQARKRVPEDEKQPARPAGLPPTKLAALAVVLLLTAALYFFNIRPALANYYTVRALIFQKAEPIKSLESFERAFRYSPPNDYELRFILIQHARDQIGLRGINEETKPLIEFAVTEAKKTIAASPQFVPNHLLLAELYLTISRPDQNFFRPAEELALEALSRAPRRYQTYSLLGRLKMSEARFEEGIEYFRQAIFLNDKFAEAHWNLAVAYILSGQAATAQSELELAYQLGFNVYEENNIEKLLQAFRDSRDLRATVKFLEDVTLRFPDNKKYRQELIELQKLLESALEAAGQN